MLVKLTQNISSFHLKFPTEREKPFFRFWFGSCCNRSPHPMEKAKRIDVTSRVLFPLIFAIFNVAYWTTYLLQANAEFEATLKTS